MDKGLANALRDDRGQALVELPFIIMLLCALTLLFVQPIVYLYTQMTLGQVASELTRVVATEEHTPTGSREILLKSYAADKLEGLPRGSAFRIPGTLRIFVTGNARSEHLEVEVSVKQRPLPLTGLLLGAGLNGDVEVTGRATTSGAWVGVEGTPRYAPQSFGEGRD